MKYPGLSYKAYVSRSLNEMIGTDVFTPAKPIYIKGKTYHQVKVDGESVYVDEGDSWLLMTDDDVLFAILNTVKRGFKMRKAV